MARSVRLMMISIGLLLVWSPVPGAIADELFICDGNKNVRVPLDKLDHMKRTNACVAAHYGLEIKDKSKPVAASKPSSHKLLSGPVRVHTKSAKGKPVASKAATTVRTLPAKSTAFKASSEIRIYKRGEALPLEEIAAEPSDHRNIKVLNAKTKPAKWYRHIY